MAILPTISPASGFTYRYDRASGAFVRTSDSFGPIYAERAETIGRGKFSFGVGHHRFRFGTLDGVDLHKVPAVFGYIQPATGVALQPYHADVISTVNNIGVNMDQNLLYGTGGVTDRFDISVAIPIVSVRVGLVSNASIIRVAGNCFTPNGILSGNATGCPVVGGIQQLQDPHSFSDGALGGPIGITDT